MEMREVVRRALQALRLPQDGGFEDVMLKLDKVKSRRTIAPRRDLRRQRPVGEAKRPGNKVA
jgi:hypothetical protein